MCSGDTWAQRMQYGDTRPRSAADAQHQSEKPQVSAAEQQRRIDEAAQGARDQVPAEEKENVVNAKP